MMISICVAWNQKIIKYDSQEYCIILVLIVFELFNIVSNQIEQNNQLLKFMYPNGCEIKELSITDDIY